MNHVPKIALLAQQQSRDSPVLQQGHASSTYLSLPPLRADGTDNVIDYNPTKCRAERWVLSKLDCVCVCDLTHGLPCFGQQQFDRCGVVNKAREMARHVPAATTELQQLSCPVPAVVSHLRGISWVLWQKKMSVLEGGGGNQLRQARGVELQGVLYLLVDERGPEVQQFEIWEVIVTVPED